ncbi:hypothetical protein A3K24_01790 [candidate division Kazan bacterium RIFCSPHIGHO2_01_FULL_44_14]|uniref:Large ribosomal subunit protein bL25 n=1 Tax=candidate division Kazan bacterium RIFCSPLOWO2_01_FULL_45_19 TaxID=1798538 RepID=A0A1F4NQX9_UNCK3|nr:MAG: hypothetical protein A3K51_01790 [candidate division Kazan bacterium RIFCSPLOWO2_01_FULL_45_19]OGB78118.1 MAG: hypothetical protein A3K24_01790 [candidate division Kazan bacterium RIFCSPHIGHO2_01_FULL_44_14]
MKVATRPADTKPDVLRRQGQVPGVVYGKNNAPVAVLADTADAGKILHQAGSSSLINLNIEGEGERTVLIKDHQFDPRTGALTHLDFYQVRLDEKIKAEVPLVFEGEAPAIETFDGVLLTSKDKLEVECLPKDLPHEFTLDLSVLQKIDDSILVKNVKAPVGVEILDEPEEVIVVVTPQRAEEVEVAPISEEEAVAGVEATAEKVDGEETPGESGSESKKDE